MNLIPASSNSKPTSNSLSSNANFTRQTQYSTYNSSTLSTQASSNNNSTSSTQVTSSTLTVPTSQVLTGEVIDLKRNEVSIKLSSKEIITVPVLENYELKMGQTITFQIVMDQRNQPALQLINTPTSPLNSTILEALEAAGLPKSERNQEIVRELLNHQMSIDKQSIQDIFRHSLVHKYASISSLVLMTKHNIPITQANAKQFDNYRNYEHRIVKEIEAITDTLPKLIDDLGKLGSASKMSDFNNQMLEILLLDDLAKESLGDPTLKLSILDTKELLSLLDKYPIDSKLRTNILEGKANLKDVVTTLYKDYELAMKMDESILETLMLEEEVDPSNLILTQDAFKGSLVNQVMEQYSSYQYELGQIGAFLTLEDRDDLFAKLKELPLTDEMNQAIKAGTITTKEILSFIKDNLPFMNEKLANSILTNDNYKKILKEHLLSKWTLTPNSITKEDAVLNLYDKMYKELSEFEELASNIKSTQDSLNMNNSLQKFENTVTTTKQNLDFMKTLNELFTYVQLPLNFKDKTIHSDLYVYTNKKELKKNKNNVSALLHLDMDYLGSIDVHVSLSYNQISTKFYLETEDSVQLVSEHIDELEDTLERKGFLFQSEIIKKEREIDIVEDFMEKESLMSSLKRYSFDIRA